VGVNGILNLNKPAGITSFSAIARIRRLTGEKRVGHAGTLDPAATGVLPVCLGQATRLTEYLHDFPKQYTAVIELGATTDTYDGEGHVTGRRSADHVTLALIENALCSFQGLIDQAPPAYSAIKVKGRQSYELARAGIKVTHQPRRVRIDSIEIIEFKPPCLKIRVRCSGGTYIRSLANDLGEKLSCGGFLKQLVRSAYGPFELDLSHSLDEVESACRAGNFDRFLYPLDYPLRQWVKLEVDEDTASKIMRGHDIAADEIDPAGNQLVSACDNAGKLVAIMKFVPETRLWHPEKVFKL
jgi:tRNA pseudouridine55 synthase